MNTPVAPEIRLSLNVPNTLTTIRVVLAAIVAWLLFKGGDGEILTAGIILLVAASTDWLDGFTARRLGHTSLFGSLYDIIADQLLFMPALILAVYAGLFDRVDGMMPYNPYPYVVPALAGGVTVLIGIITYMMKRKSRAFEFPTPTMMAKVNYWFWLAPLIVAIFKIGPDILLAVLMYLAVISTVMTFYSYLRKGSYVFTD